MVYPLPHAVECPPEEGTQACTQSWLTLTSTGCLRAKLFACCQNFTALCACRTPAPQPHTHVTLCPVQVLFVRLPTLALAHEMPFAVKAAKYMAWSAAQAAWAGGPHTTDASALISGESAQCQLCPPGGMQVFIWPRGGGSTSAGCIQDRLQPRRCSKPTSAPLPRCCDTNSWL